MSSGRSTRALQARSASAASASISASAAALACSGPSASMSCVSTCLVQLALARQRALARAEHLVLEALELRGDEALRRLHGLAADIVLRHALGVAPRDLDEEPLHAVVAELEAREPGALALAPLQLEQKFIGVRGDAPQLIELGVVAGGDHLAVAHQRGRLVGDRGARAARALRRARRCARAAAAAAGSRAPASAARSAGSAASELRSCVRSRGRAERSATRARMRSTSPTPRSCSRSALEAPPIDQRAERVIALAQQRLAAQRAVEPAAQLPRAHGGDAAVDDGEQRRVRVAGETRVELEIAAAGGIEQQRVAALLDVQRADVRQRRASACRARTAAALRRRGWRAAARRRRSP